MNNRIFKMALILLSFLFFSQVSFAVKGSDPASQMFPKGSDPVLLGSDRFSLMFPKGSDPVLLGSDRFSLMFPKGSDPASQGLTPYIDSDSLLKKIKEYGGVLINLEDNKLEEKIISIESPYEKRTRREKEMIKEALEALGYTVSKERQEELNSMNSDVSGRELEAHNQNDIFHDGSDNELIIDGSQIEGTAVLPDGNILEAVKEGEKGDGKEGGENKNEKGNNKEDKKKTMTKSEGWFSFKGVVNKIDGMIKGVKKHVSTGNLLNTVDKLKTAKISDNNSENNKQRKITRISFEDLMNGKLKDNNVHEEAPSNVVDEHEQKSGKKKDDKAVSKVEVSKAIELVKLFEGGKANIDLSVSYSNDWALSESQVAEYIRDMLQKNRLVALKFALNTPGLVEEVFPAIVSGLENNTSLQRLDLHGSKLRGKDADIFVKASVLRREKIEILGLEFVGHVINSDMPLDVKKSYLRRHFPYLKEGTDEYCCIINVISIFLKSEKESQSGTPLIVSQFDDSSLRENVIINAFKEYYLGLISGDTDVEPPNLGSGNVDNMLEGAKTLFLKAINDPECTDEKRADLAYRMYIIYQLVNVYVESFMMGYKIEATLIRKRMFVFLAFAYAVNLKVQYEENNDRKDHLEFEKKQILELLTFDLKAQKLTEVVPYVIGRFFDGNDFWLFKLENDEGFLATVRVIFSLFGKELIENAMKEKKAEMERKKKGKAVLEKKIEELTGEENKHLVTISLFKNSKNPEQLVWLKDAQVWIKKFESEQLDVKYGEELGVILQELKFCEDFLRDFLKVSCILKMKDVDDFIEYLSQALVLIPENEYGNLREVLKELKKFAELVKKLIEKGLKEHKILDEDPDEDEEDSGEEFYF